MRVISATLGAALLLALPTLVAAQPGPAPGPQITCSQIPAAQRFVDGLKPGPNTRNAQRHLDAAKRAADARDDQRCVSELTEVNEYATRSANADKRGATHRTSASRTRRHRVQCADALHQNRPGGTDYHGPAVAGCPQRAL